MKRKMSLALFVALCGCASLDYAMTNYQGVTPQTFNDGKAEWRMFDKPAEGRMMVTVGLGEAAVSGMTFGLSRAPAPSYRNAAQGFLSSTGRQCHVTDTALIIDPQYEVFYECP